MSVIMTLWGRGDPEKIEQYAAENKEQMRSIVERAKENGLIAHRFYGSDGQIMVIDEWPDAESFQRFFASNEAEIAPIMEAAGITDEPSVAFWRKLETHDEHGWD
jgi:heme-degrading monooxygenase HmoA